MGLDLSKGIIRNNLEYGVIEPAMSKFATEAAITILRINHMIKLTKTSARGHEDVFKTSAREIQFDM
nr:unnamed protein product [Digitaria exilis]